MSPTSDDLHELSDPVAPPTGAPSGRLQRTGLYVLGTLLIIGGTGFALFFLLMAVVVGAVMDGPTGMPATDPGLGIVLAIVGLGSGGLLIWGGSGLVRHAKAR